jgi:hypothetical protein
MSATAEIYRKGVAQSAEVWVNAHDGIFKRLNAINVTDKSNRDVHHHVQTWQNRVPKGISAKACIINEKEIGILLVE